jgi:hypothetical protein
MVGWRKLHTEELHNLSKTNRAVEDLNDIEKGETCSTHVIEEECIQNITGKARRKETTRRSRRRLEDNIKRELREIGRDNMDWICLAENKA